MNSISSIKDALKKAHDEVNADTMNKMTAEELKLHAIAKKLLLLERDLKASGQSQTSETRVSRLLEVIEKESF